MLKKQVANFCPNESETFANDRSVRVSQSATYLQLLVLCVEVRVGLGGGQLGFGDARLSGARFHVLSGLRLLLVGDGLLRSKNLSVGQATTRSRIVLTFTAITAAKRTATTEKLFILDDFI